MAEPTRTARDKRFHLRFDKVFPVIVGSEIYGDSPGIARNISEGGMLVEMVEPLPIGSLVTVQFEMPDSDDHIAVRAEIKHSYCFNFASTGEPASARGVGLRFIECVLLTARGRRALGAGRVLH
ncbi:MAG TPA: PilZ domain-containing protein [Kofleriaceae bacterium]|nr:PilZ domain-containing protein [Kofleriaceae bacterium]